jgi:transposase-like protein
LDLPVLCKNFKEASDVTDDDLSKAYELDETAACVEITEESKRKIAEIPNVIGKSKCSLCKRIFTDVFRLAMHRCPRIVHAEYKCPECDKVILDIFR